VLFLEDENDNCNLCSDGMEHESVGGVRVFVAFRHSKQPGRTSTIRTQSWWSEVHHVDVVVGYRCGGAKWGVAH
jgi:hypothetical protein